MEVALKKEVLRTLIDDFEYCADHCYRINDKTGNLLPLRFNKLQRYVHDKIEAQKAEIGKVRALLLKYRQGGGSTYIAGRFYHATTMGTGQQAYIMAHEAKATTNLYNIVRRIHDNNPYAPDLEASNAQELKFAHLDGGYRLATAGSKDTGRSSTVQRLHASEFAFWENAALHMAGIGNTVADLPGTEIIVETTANGKGNTFHDLWEQAIRGEGEFIPIFVPWMWQDEYRAKVRSNFELSSDDELYMRTFGCDMEQMQWRANKIATYAKGFSWLFDQEFPATPDLAFQTPTKDPLISPLIVARAMRNTFRDASGPLIIGCDPAEGGTDRTAIVWRRGRVVLRVEAYAEKGPMEVAGMLAGYWVTGDGKGNLPDAIFLDTTNSAGIRDRLHELNVPAIGVHFAEAASRADDYLNKRAEMWYALRDWLDDDPCRLPNDPALASDLSAPGYRPSSDNRMMLEKKDEMKRRGIRSPDLGDALALTFAHPVVPRSAQTYSGNSGFKPAGRAGY